jgi:hypothetical protein
MTRVVIDQEGPTDSSGERVFECGAGLQQAKKPKRRLLSPVDTEDKHVSSAQSQQRRGFPVLSPH